MSAINFDEYLQNLKQKLKNLKQVLEQLEKAEVEFKMGLEIKKNEILKEVTEMLKDYEPTSMGLSISSQLNLEITDQDIWKILAKTYHL